MIVINRVYVTAILASVMAFCSHPSLASQESLEVLQNIEKSMNRSVDPCDDFYQYACGNFKGHDPFTLAMQKFESALASMLNDYDGNDDNLHRNQNFGEKTAIFYQSCLNVSKWELLRYLDEIKPGSGLEWPMVAEMKAHQSGDHLYNSSKWPDKQFDIVSLVADLNSYGVSNIFLQTTPMPIGDILFANLVIPNAENLLTAAAIDKILSNFHLPADSLLKHRNDILYIQTQWQATLKRFKALQQKESTVASEISSFRQSNPEFAAFLEKSMPGVLTSSVLLAVEDMSYIRFLLAKQWQPLEAQQFCNYLMVRLLQHIRNSHRTKCATDVRKKFGMAVNFLYHERFYSHEAKNNTNTINNMVQHIQKYLLEALNENHLNLTKGQLDEAKRFITQPYVNIGILPTNMTAAAIDRYYEQLPNFEINNFYHSDLMALRQKQYETFKCFDDMTMGCTDGYESSPLNSVNLNLILLPFAALLMPLYHEHLDPLLSVSSLGFFLAHELTHSIDSESIKTFGTDEETYTDVTTNPNYQESIECLQQHYPTTNMVERVADVVGTRVAYRAYLEEYKGQQPNFTRLPWKQLFFLNLIQPFCEEKQVESTTHDTDNIRGQIIAMNMPEYAEAFQCPKGSRMNPVKKCRFY